LPVPDPARLSLSAFSPLWIGLVDTSPSRDRSHVQHNETDPDGANVEASLDTSVESTASPPSYLRIRSESETQSSHVFNVKTFVFNLGEYSIFEISHVSGQRGFSEEEPLALHLSRSGNDATDASLPYTDYGLVNELPSSPSAGDRCIFEASESLLWQLVYNGKGSYP